jgi:formate/nitrite transporter FocA (FNT family)
MENQTQSGSTVQLSKTEEGEVRKRRGLRAAVVFEAVRREGETELSRAPLALAFSGLSAGLSMGFSLIVTGLLRAYLPDQPWRVLVENFGYTSGFLIVVLGRQQLFTENTLTVILPLLDDTDKQRTLYRVARLWVIVLLANLVGALLVALVLVHTPAFMPPVQSAFLQLSREASAPGFWPVLVRGVFAGWLIALMVWLLPVADTQKLWVVVILTYIVGLAGLSHIVAGSVEVLYGVVAGATAWSTYFGAFLLPVFIGNVIGGVLLVSLVNYGQVKPEGSETEAA